MLAGKADSKNYRISKEQFEALSRDFTVVPVWTEVAADLETPVSAYMKLAQGSSVGAAQEVEVEQFSFLLESVEHGERWGRYSFIGLDPFLVLSSNGGEVRLQNSLGGSLGLEIPPGDPLETVRSIFESLTAPTLPGLPPLFAGGVGYLGYDVVNYLEKLPQTTERDVPTPELLLMFPRVLLGFDHLRQRMVVVSNILRGEDYDASLERTERLLARLDQPLAHSSLGLMPVEPEIPGSTLTKEQFTKAVEAAKEHILAGDIFQVVLAHRFSVALTGDPFNMYRALRLINPSPYMFYLRHPQITVLGSSPEPLVKVQEGKVIQRPIAGTRPRGATSEEDLEIEVAFRNDEKEKAEHVMLVDLSRNDLGRVCEFGSVEVDELMEVERYSHVMHLVSQVSGRLASGKSAIDALYASFPAGTVSGAPKIRAMEIIDELEPTSRGPYAGVVGYLDLSGNLDTCIALRTAYVVDGIVYIQAGAGIVADSDPDSEWEETLNKARALLTAAAMAEAQSP